jgi:hypothetical protein
MPNVGNRFTILQSIYNFSIPLQVYKNIPLQYWNQFTILQFYNFQASLNDRTNVFLCYTSLCLDIIILGINILGIIILGIIILDIINLGIIILGIIESPFGRTALFPLKSSCNHGGIKINKMKTAEGLDCYSTLFPSTQGSVATFD